MQACKHKERKKMNTVQKITPQSEVLQKTLNLLNQHSDALQEFEKNCPALQNIYESAVSLEVKGKSLLATQGINKNILGFQSILLQNDEWKKRWNLIQNEIAQSQQQLSIKFQNMITEQTRITQLKLRQAMENIDNQLALKLERSMKIIREYTSQDLISQQDFLRQITERTPFIDKLQSELAKFDSLFPDTKTIETLIHSSQLMTSTLSVAIETINFSSELDKLPHEEQLKILAYLESLDIDNETEIIIPDDLPSEIQSDYITLNEFLRNFLKINQTYILGILTTVETTVKNFSENNFSNPFTIFAFVYFCVALLLNQIKDDDN